MFDLYCRGWNETRDGMEERKQDKKLCQFECSENESDNISYCRSCYISTEIGRHTRRCFITGGILFAADEHSKRKRSNIWRK